MAIGRFAPSPTGPLHLGNLRTALVAWLTARSAGSRFLLRVEDLDRQASRPDVERGQLEDLAALGTNWDGDVVHQHDRFADYEAALERLTAAGVTYPCFCTRREVAEATRAPHGSVGSYPGTCRDLPVADQAARTAAGRPASLRLRADARVVTFTDALHGTVEGRAEDVVLRRNDGAPAYQLAVVVDDAAQGIEQVVRGDDLLASTPTQVRLGQLLSLPTPTYVHVPLVLGPDGERLAKRHGAVSLADQRARGRPPEVVRGILAAGLGLAEPGEEPSMDELLDRFVVARIPREPWIVPPALA